MSSSRSVSEPISGSHAGSTPGSAPGWAIMRACRSAPCGCTRSRLGRFGRVGKVGGGWNVCGAASSTSTNLHDLPNLLLVHPHGADRHALPNLLLVHPHGDR